MNKESGKADEETGEGISSEQELKNRNKRGERISPEMEGMEGVAVAVRAAFKRHSVNAVILRGLDMTVREGHIYGLLGPSGCGKTTLLRSIVGIGQLDKGTIYVKAHWRDRVGYMPQDIGLYDYMTIMEAFYFYGKLYGMKAAEVKDRGQELVDFLELPKGSRLIKTLSGGQQRRLSFAVTLLHDPDLLILDEPTVGVDPVLCAAIWDRLVEMTTQGKTIIITTHYIEETKQAHTIGLMRDGVLLSEQSPQKLMKEQKCESLEEAFLRLSKRQEEENKNVQAQKTKKFCCFCKKAADDSYPKREKKCLCVDKEKNAKKPTLVDLHPYWSFMRFWAQLVKNSRFMWRNWHTTAFNLLLPACIVLLCQLTLGKNIGDDKSIGVVSAELTHGADSCKAPVVLENCTDIYQQKLTCAMIQQFQRFNMKMVVYKDLEAGKKAARRNTVWGTLYFHPNYTGLILERMVLGLGLKASSELIDDTFIDAYMDMSDMWISTYLRRGLKEGVRVVLRQLLKECKEKLQLKSSEHLLDDVLSNKTIVYGDAEPTFLEFFIPGVVCTFAFYLSIMFTTGAIMFERSIGLERSLVAGMTKFEVILAHSVIQIIIAVCQQFIVLLVFYLIYTHTMVGSIFKIILLLVLLQIMGLFYGLVLGLFFKRESDATNAGIGTVNALFMLAGVLWPEEGMHKKYLRPFIKFIPVQPAVEAYRAIAMRNWPLSHHTVYLGFASTLTWTAIFILLTILIVHSHKGSL